MIYCPCINFKKKQEWSCKYRIKWISQQRKLLETKRQLRNYKMKNLPGRHKNPKCVKEPKNRVKKLIKQKNNRAKRRNRQIHIIVEDTNSPLSAIDRTTRQHQQEFRRTEPYSQQNLIDIIKHSTIKTHKIFNNNRIPIFSSTHGMLIDYILGHKTNLNRIKQIEIMQDFYFLIIIESN